MKYEIHVTVKCNNVEQFKKDCQEIGVKPIVIETENAGVYLEQVMTSSKYDDDNQVSKLKQLRNQLIEMGYKILRLKVEIFPEAEKNPNFIYYESHLRLKLPKGFDRSILHALCDKWDVHMSKNLFKRNEEFDYQMLTYRNYEIDYADFIAIIKGIGQNLEKLGIAFDKVEIEECIYDSNTGIDDSWLNMITEPEYSIG